MSSRTAETSETVTVCKSFEEMGLKQSLLRGIYAHGWETPSRIQSKAVIPMVCGKDLIAQDQAGSGKTGAFATGALQIVDNEIKATQILVLSPTRELAFQSFEVFEKLATFMEVSLHASVGGVHRREDMNNCRRNPEVVIGTPGRVCDMINCGALQTNQLSCLILDEADTMLSRGFQDAIYDVFQCLPQNVQVVLVSATFPQECLDLSNKFMQNPVALLFDREDLTVEGISQYYVNCERNEHKFETLCELYEMISVPQVIIFCRSRRAVEVLADDMTRDDHCVSYLHGEMSQEERQLRMKEFRTGSSRVLITTNLIARGIDIPAVQLVINYDLPHGDMESYLHRIGRSGRYGKKGVAINFLTNHRRDLYTLRELEEFYNIKIGELPYDVCDALAF